MTGAGNNTYLLTGNGEATLVDAGAGDQRHLDDLARKLNDSRATLTYVLVTHAHADHASGAPALASAHPTAIFMKYPWPAEDAQYSITWRTVFDRAPVPAGDDTLIALHTPGHSPDHLALWHEPSGTIFSGDLVVLGSSVMIHWSRGGNLAQYLESLERLRALAPRRLLPAHGPIIEDPHAVLTAYLNHRREREHEVVAALQAGRETVQTIAESIYHGLSPALVAAAHENVRAHLEKLQTEGRATEDDGRWSGRSRRIGASRTESPTSRTRGDIRDMDNVIDFINVNRDRYLDELKALLAIPSISALPAHASDVKRCADWCAGEMRRIGLQNVRLIETPGYPVVYGDWLGAPGAPTILFYGHYDVQPVDPLELWESPPFEATIRDGEIYARGSADDKGQVFMHFKAVEAHLTQNGRLPVNIKFILEGEEEVGSANLDDFVRAHRADLAADVVVISDSPMFARGVPSICYGLRGLVYFQIDLRGSSTDLHSGSFGGAVANPAFVLAQMIAQMKDRGGRIRVPGFYDDVVPLKDEERQAWASLPFNEKKYRKDFGIPKVFGETDYTTLERTWARPTLEVNGLLSGFTGEGAKTVLPAVSMAKISMRLVPNQDPNKIAELFDAYVRKLAPKTMELKITRMHGGKPWMTSFDNPYVQAAGRAIEKGFGQKPVFTREGGSVPVVSTFQEELGLPSVLFGVGLPDENAHAPNERLDVANFQGGIIAAAILYQEIADGAATAAG
jgi:acetylornithine deacetylase/succinyl-diaminopimelate desuccinylase-like protein/glyoxylase-like metal-dependent hydrolase (beta-lactamase superfamily II)